MAANQDADPHEEYRRQAAEHFARQPSAHRPANTHSDYHKQTAEHFGRPDPASAPRPPASAVPRIYRGPQQPPAPPTSSHDEANTTALDTGAGPTSRLPHANPQHFGAGTTYTGAGRRQPTPRVTPPRPPTPRPANLTPRPPDPTPARPVVPPQTGPPLPYPDSRPYASATPSSPAAPSQGLNLQPEHALWILTGLSVLAMLTSSWTWLLVVAGCAAAAWYCRTRRVVWPSDIEELLVRARLTQSAGATTSKPPVRPMLADPQDAGPAATSFIPFRPMSIGEMFGGGVKIVVKHWPSLVGIPVALLIAAVAAGAALGLVAGHVMMASISSADSLDSMLSGMIAMYVVAGILVYVLAFPLDALLIALSVIATNKAVRGEVIRAGEVFQLARRRMFAVCRLTLFYYTIFIVSDIVVYGVVFAALFVSTSAGMAFMLLLLAANFAFGLLFSLAPVVLVIEGRGVIDSLKRSLELTRSAWARLLGIHVVWAVGVSFVMMLPWFAWFTLGLLGFIVVMVLAFGVLIAWFRTMQVLIYTDLRMRREHYEQELLADWSRNTATR